MLLSKLVCGEPPADFLVWRGVNFRGWVLEMLKRPEIVKSIRRQNSNGVLRLIWHVLMASHAAGMGDLKKLYRHLLMAFLSMPASMKTGPFGKYLLQNACDVKKLLKNGRQITEEQKTDAKEYYLAFIPEVLLHHLLNRTTEDERRQHFDEITTIVANLKNI
ncbi:MAG: hypothetical protein QXH35_05180 [Nitrososphaerota archaeon]